MKALLTTILILITTIGFTQPLMIGFRKSDVVSNMHNLPDIRRTVTAKDYLEYQRGNTAYSFRFMEDTCNLYYGRWFCSEFTVCMPVESEYKYLSKLIECDCLEPVNRDLWLWKNDYDTIQVQRIYQGDLVSFVFTEQ